MKIYTKTGDSGKTSLYDGNRASKYLINFEVIGEIDELSSRIGLLYAYIQNLISNKDESMLEYYKYLLNLLRKIQCNLQNFNSYIATLEQNNRRLPELDNNMIEELEQSIDHMEQTNPSLVQFILPGVSQTDAQAHLCRTQTRKAERVLVYLHDSKEILSITKKDRDIQFELENFLIPEIILKYMNRLSDFFFVLARWLCYENQSTDCFMNEIKK